MVTIIETKGWPHVFNLADGSSMRLFPNERKSIKKSLVSEEITSAAEMGFVFIAEEVPESKAGSNKTDSKKKEKQEV